MERPKVIILHESEHHLNDTTIHHRKSDPSHFSSSASSWAEDDQQDEESTVRKAGGRLSPLHREPIQNVDQPTTSPVPITQTKTQLPFFLFGLLNNIAFVVTLSAAEDLVPNYAGVVLISGVVPGILSKLTFNSWAHKVSYTTRIVGISIVPCVTMFIIAWVNVRWTRLVCIGVISFVSGIGESTFLGLAAIQSVSASASASTSTSTSTSMSGNGIAWWSSGTGFSGLFGALVFFLLTQPAKLSIPVAISMIAPWMLLSIVLYFAVVRTPKYDQPIRFESSTKEAVVEEDGDEMEQEQGQQESRAKSNTAQRMDIFRTMLVGFFISLMFVYLFEYTINQGILPVIDFVNVDANPGTRNSSTTVQEGYRLGTFILRRNWRMTTPDQSSLLPNQLESRAEESTLVGITPSETSKVYVQYQVLYQLGVFISRSSIALFSTNKIWIMALLQLINLTIFLIQALTYFIPYKWVVFILVLWEGLLGGAAYVNTFYCVSTTVPQEHVEWSVATVTIGDALGISLASVIDTFLECGLRKAQHRSC